jgi:hypothetical protein
MIGSSLPLCYPQIVVSDLLDHRAFRWIPPLTKHIRLGVRPAFSDIFRGLGRIPFRRQLHPPTPSG